MIKRYGNIQVVATNEFKKGVIVETVFGRGTIAREYVKNEYGELDVGETICEVDMGAIVRQKNPITQMKELSKQLEGRKFAIDEYVVNTIKQCK